MCVCKERQITYINALFSDYYCSERNENNFLEGKYNAGTHSAARKLLNKLTARVCWETRYCGLKDLKAVFT